MRSLSILLRASVIASILLLAGQGQPDIANADGRGLSQSPPFMANVPKVPVSPNEAKVKKNLSYGNIPLYFIPNKGQVNETARFYARASRYTLWLTAEGLVFDRSVSKGKPVDRTKAWGKERTLSRVEEQPVEGKREVHRLNFMGVNPDPTIEGEGGTGHIANYFIGSDPAKWHPNIATSRAAVYKELYPNIDLKVYGVEKQIEYDWLVKPGGDPEAIDFAYQDVLGTEVDAEGNLIIRTELGEFRHRRPIAYQEGTDGTRESVQARFRRLGPDRYGFSLGDYDPTRPLIIDPVVLIYSTYLGGGDDDFSTGMAVDSSGCAYICGTTNSIDFPVENAFQSYPRGYYDAFVTKLTAAGNDIIYSTYFGGTYLEDCRGLAVDSSGCVYATGYTLSDDFPTRNAFQPNMIVRSDAFVTKLSALGNDLIYSTYLGGSLSDHAFGISLDSSGCAYVVGDTQSADFPIRNPFQATLKSLPDVFVTKFSADGRDLAYSTFLGGNSWDNGSGIFVDRAGCAFITGQTFSFNFPTQNPFQPNKQGEQDFPDAFVTKLSAGGNSLIYSTYLGGSWYEGHYGGPLGGICVDNFGCAYVTGETGSQDFPVRNPFQANLRAAPDVFVTKFSAAGDELVFSTYLGGGHIDEGWGISLDNANSIFVTGFTWSSDFPSRNAFQENLAGAGDAFVIMLKAAGNDAIYSTYLGGSRIDHGTAIAIDSAGAVYVSGSASSSDFPVQNALQPTFRGALYDAFVAKLYMESYTVAASVSGGGGTVSPATQTVVPGESASVNIYPDTGYAIASITDNGGSVAVANPYVINNVQEDHAVVVTFDHVYTVTASVSGFGGSVNPTTQTVMAGGTATIEIYPDLGYHTGSIRDNGVSVAIASPYVITSVQEDHAVVVTFANAPPTIKIINPTNGAKVYGVVTVKAEASDDLRVLNVAFLIDEQLIGEDAFAEPTNLYTQAWDTRGYAAGIHRVKAVAFDEAGLTAEDAINVIIENVALTLQGQRLTESAWILKKQFIRLTIGIQNLGQVSVAKYVIYRKNGAGDFKAVKEIPGNEVTGPTYVWVDKSINKNQTYTYRVLALSSSGVALGVSNDFTL